MFSAARLTIRSFGIRRNEQIACHVTVRGEAAIKIIEKVCFLLYTHIFFYKVVIIYIIYRLYE